MSKEIAKKIAVIMNKVKYIQKKGRNAFHKYNYATEADVNDAVRDHMAELNMIMVPSVKESSIRETKTRSGNTEYIARVDMDFTFIDGDSGESITLSMSGEGQDTGDKAIYKAISGTQKYAIMKLFMIPTGDDPERDDTDQRMHEQPKQPQRPNTAPQTFTAPDGIIELWKGNCELTGKTYNKAVFDTWYTGQRQLGKSDQELENFLAGQMAEKATANV